MLDRVDSRPFDQLFQSKIFEFLEINGGLHLKSFGDFGASMQKLQSFPKVINPRENEKFIFFPERVQDSSYYAYQEPILFIEVETFEKNQGSNWSFIDFPLNISDKVWNYWILQV